MRILLSGLRVWIEVDYSVSMMPAVVCSDLLNVFSKQLSLPYFTQSYLHVSDGKIEESVLKGIIDDDDVQFYGLRRY